MKKIIYGILSSAIGFIANFGTLENQNNTGVIYAHILADTYDRIYTTYSIMLCLPITDSPCGYTELYVGRDIVTETFTSSQAQDWVKKGYLTPLGSGIFIGQ